MQSVKPNCPHCWLLLGVLLLMDLGASVLAGRVDFAASPIQENITRAQDSYRPLSIWLQRFAYTTETPPCVILQAANHGLASNFKVLMLATAIMKQLRPSMQIYYDHSESPYQCSGSKSVESFLQPANRVILTSQPPDKCDTWDWKSLVPIGRGLLSSKLDSIISENGLQDHKPITSFQQGLRRHLLLDDMFQSVCPIIDDWWHLTSDLQQQADAIKREAQSTERPVVAIHARGGDKIRELGKYIDPETNKYPMERGMRRLIATHPSIQVSPPTCLILSDDYQYAQTVKAMAQDILKCQHFIMRVPNDPTASYEIKVFRHMPEQIRCEAAKEYLIDIELMSWATYLIANHRANADSIAAFLRKCRFYHDMSTIVPGTGASAFTFWV